MCISISSDISNVCKYSYDDESGPIQMSALYEMSVLETAYLSSVSLIREAHHIIVGTMTSLCVLTYHEGEALIMLLWIRDYSMRPERVWESK